jgi:AraC-like DNA-binding protein
MQPIFEKINNSESESFFHKLVEEPYFSAPWHFHPEVEIFLVLEGTGTRYVGDGISNFNPGDLAIIGANTPHVWSSSEDYYQKDLTRMSKGICIQFEEIFWGNHFSELPELIRIKELFQNAKRGIRFKNEIKSEIREKLIALPSTMGMKRLMLLLEILDLMATTKNYKYLSSPNYKPAVINTEDLGRIEKIYQYVLKNFTMEIQLEDVSALINLSPQSFCRYFKSRTNKVFFTFLNEVRIGHACKLLIENNQNVAQICYESGFNHLSNFNRQFKKIKGMTPSEFQKRYMEGSFRKNQ